MLRQLLAAGWLACLVATPVAAAGTPVRVGITSSASDVSLFIAHKRGYFAAEGLDVSFTTFNSAAQMIAPFTAGEIDIGTGATSAAFYNGISRGIDLRIVADKNSTPPGRGTQPLLVRKDHMDSGRYKSLADLKGFRIGVSAPGTSAMTTVTRALEKGGLKVEDVDLVALAFPQHVIALTNKALDAAFTVEPSASEAVRLGSAIRIMGDDEVYPYHQLSVMQAAGRFAQAHPQALTGFLKALLRGVRDFNEALVDGRYAGPKGDAVAAILAEYGPFKDPAIYKSFNTSYSDPDGKLNIESLRDDLAYFRKAGLIQGDVTIEKALDLSFLEAAVKQLGPYRKP
jgi:NitT/TauT family transport system substrate-binding protein